MNDATEYGSPDSPSTVLVTGAAGGLGIHLVGELSAAGWRVLAYDQREVEKTRRQCLLDGEEDAQWLPAGNTEGLESALGECNAVVHAASIASLSASESALMKGNHDFTERLFIQATEAGVDHFVHISCASVYRTDAGVCTEASPTEAYNAFEQSKLDAEDTLRKLSERGRQTPSLTILRLGLLYGPGCTSMGAGLIPLPAILRGISRYLPGLTGGPRTNWCHVTDAARAVETVLRHPDGRGRTFNVADETALSFGEVLTSIIEGYGIDLGPSVRMPRVALWTLLGPLLDTDWSLERMRAILEVLWRRAQRAHGIDSPLAPRLNRDALFYIRDDAIVVADALRELGWSPQWPDYRQGIADTIRWYQRQGWAPRFDLDALAERRDATPSSSRLGYQERLHGKLDDGDTERSLDLVLDLSWRSLPLPPARREGHLRGTLTVPELAAEAAIEGTVELHWRPMPHLDYQFGFRDLDDRACRFVGARQVKMSSPVESFLRLEGTVFNERGQAVGEVRARSTDSVLPMLTATSLSSSS